MESSDNVDGVLWHPMEMTWESVEIHKRSNATQQTSHGNPLDHVREARFQAHSKTVVFKNKCLKGGLPPMLSSLLLLLGLGGLPPPVVAEGGLTHPVVVVA